MYYTIYKITNQIDGKFYVGSHKTKDLNDNYMGSGKYLKRAIEKYGIKNFSKEILFVFDTPEEMYDKEKEIVNEDFLTTENTYNLKIGGFGGWDHTNYTPFDGSEYHKKFSQKGAEKFCELFNNDLNFRENWLKNIKIVQQNAVKKNKEKYPNGIWHGKKHTTETKNKISLSSKGKHDGIKNSQYGSMWIHSLYEKKSKKINKNEPIPTGWFIGRKIKF
jgi:group I intron endonuclease